MIIAMNIDAVTCASVYERCRQFGVFGFGIVAVATEHELVPHTN